MFSRKRIQSSNKATSELMGGTEWSGLGGGVVKTDECQSKAFTVRADSLVKIDLKIDQLQSVVGSPERKRNRLF